jgi:predicted ribosomally synthesized peptide with SipW-like signal peptide
MAYSRKVLTVGALGVAALALIGTGAGATFHDSAQAQQNITAGNLSVWISSDSGTTDGKTVTLPKLSDEPSHFSGPQESITVKNTGSVPATVTGFTATDTTNVAANNAALEGALNIQLVDSKNNVIYDGPFSAFKAGGSFPIPFGGTTLAANGASMTIYVTFSSTGNSDAINGGLPDAAQGGSVTPTLTANVTG